VRSAGGTSARTATMAFAIAGQTPALASSIVKPIFSVT